MSALYYQSVRTQAPGNVLSELYREVAGLLDRPAYEVEGHVVNPPIGFEYPSPIYDFARPYQAPDETKLILLALFFLLALAIIFRR